MGYLLSVVIPTKDRFIYLKETVLTLLSFNQEELEIIIHDNSCDDREMVGFLNSLKRDNIKYFHVSDKLSQTENSDLALEKATGDYCCYIGDDDSLSLSALDVAKYLKQKRIDACVFDMSTYHWSDVVFAGKEKPTLSINCSKGFVKKMNKEKVLKSFLKYGCQDISFIPRVYHGIISRSVLMNIKMKTGTFFPGPSPDMANAVASILSVNNYVYVRAPIVLSGFSFKSAGGMGLRNMHKGPLSSAKQLPKNVEQYWNERVPKIWLGYTIWTESSSKAFIAMGRRDLNDKINYYAMYAKIFLKYREYRDLVINENKGLKFLRLLYEITKLGIRYVAIRIRYRVRVISKRQFICFQKISIDEAFRITNEKSKDILKGVL